MRVLPSDHVRRRRRVLYYIYIMCNRPTSRNLDFSCLKRTKYEIKFATHTCTHSDVVVRTLPLTEICHSPPPPVVPRARSITLFFFLDRACVRRRRDSSSCRIFPPFFRSYFFHYYRYDYIILSIHFPSVCTARRYAQC